MSDITAAPERRERWAWEDTRGTLETLDIPADTNTGATQSFTIPAPERSGVFPDFPLIRSSLGPGPRKHRRDPAKAKKRRRMQKASRRRNRR